MRLLFPRPWRVGVLVLLSFLGLSAADADPATDMRRVIEGVKFETLTTREGLSQNGVFDTAQDQHGFLWFASRDGLNRYDGQRFKIYYRDFQDNQTLLDNQISEVAVAGDGSIWCSHLSGLSRLNPVTDRVQRFPAGAPGSPSGIDLWFLFAALDGRLFVGHEKGFSRFDDAAGVFVDVDLSALAADGVEGSRGVSFPGDDIVWLGTNQGVAGYRLADGVVKKFQVDENQPQGLNSNMIYAIDTGPDRKLWLGTDLGIGLLDTDTGHFEPADFGDASWQVGPIDLLYDSRGLLWIATRQGIVLYDPRSGYWKNHRNHPSDPRSLCQDNVYDFFEDRSGMIWIGTFGGGVSKYNRASETISHLQLDPEVLNNYDFGVFGFVEGEDGTVYIATDARGILAFDPTTGKAAPALDIDSSGGTEVVFPHLMDILPAPDGIWVGSRAGFKFYDPKRRNWRLIPSPVEDKYPAAAASIQDLEPGPHGSVYMATLAGLVQYQPRDGTWRRWAHDPDDPDSLPFDMLISVTQTQDAVWLGTRGNGLLRFDGQNRFRQFKADGANPNALSHGFILTMTEGADGRLWIGTLGGGLNVYDPQADRFKRYTRKDGLVNEKVFGLQFDAAGDLWIATNRGISRFNLETEQFRNFGLSHNLQANEFGRGAVLRARDGTLYFGGLNGINFFDPGAVKTGVFEPELVLSELSVLNQPLPLDRELADLDQITFSYADRAIEFRFAALDFRAPLSLRYAYRVSGLNDDWVSLGNKGDISFPKLAPGNYELEVRVADSDGKWVEHTRKLAIVVKPPYWATPLAYGAYLFGGLLALGFFLRRQQNKLREAEAINQRLVRVDQLKDEFLANTSHELRTPIHGLVGLAESLLAGAAGPVSAPMAENLRLMVLSGKRLDNLVNDILDFSKLKQHDLVLNLRAVDLHAVVEAVLAVCQPLAADKNLSLVNAVANTLPLVNADEARLQQVLYNLVGNAVKFSDRGEVRIVAEREGNTLRIAVHDQGIGFEQANAETLFESFQQGDGSMTREYGGTGLGLAISRRLIERMAGRIWAEGRPGEGASFYFELPVAGEKTLAGYRGHPQGQPVHPVLVASADAASGDAAPSMPAPLDIALPDNRLFRILAVDDEVANRRILANLLQVNNYEVLLASNGLEALEIIEREKLDLVLLDVMMPRMTGFEVCKRVRARYSLQELPIIFLTAKNQGADLVTAFSLGANDFLTKPFSRDMLLSRVKPHLELLDINRNLEAKVHERTRALKEYTHELETLDRIVKTINREMSAEGLLPTLLQQGMALFANVRCGTLLLRNARDHLFYLSLDSQCEDFFENQAYTEAAVRQRFLNSDKQLDSDIYSMPVPSPGEVGDLGWFLIVALYFDGRLEGVMFLMTSTDPAQVKVSEFSRLQRFREHAVAAVGRVRTLYEMAEKQRERVATAHLVGMAENARAVLHNMGNSLNSINISSEVIERKLAQSNWVTLADRLFVHFAEALASFDQGQRLSDTLRELFGRIERRDEVMHEEIRRMRRYLNQSLDVLREQHALSGVSEIAEALEINQLVQACGQAVEVGGTPIQFTFHQGLLPVVHLPKIKFMLMVAGLLRYIGYHAVAGGEQALPVEISTEERDKKIWIYVRCHSGGLDEQERAAIFDQNNPGELHNCANIANEIGGTIDLLSDGPGSGLMVCIVLPVELRQAVPVSAAG